MATDSERLVVALEARVNQFERELAKAERTAARQATSIQNRFNAANRNVAGGMQRLAGQIRMIEGPLGGVAGRFSTFNAQLREIGPAAAIAVAGIGGVTIAAQRLYSFARSTVSELSALAKAADRVGLATDDFQRLQFGFQLAGVEAREFESSMEQFARRMGEAATRGGRLAEILEANGVAIRDANGNMRSSMDLLRDYAELIRRAGSDQERLVLAQEAFGRAGLDFVNALRKGEAAIDDMADAADNAGGVIEERLLRKAEEFDDRFAAGWRNFEVNAKSSIMNVLADLDQLSQHSIWNLLGQLATVSTPSGLAGRLAGGGVLPPLPNPFNDDVTGLQQQLRLLRDARDDRIALEQDASDVVREIAKLDKQLQIALRQQLGGQRIGVPGEPPAAGGEGEPPTIIPPGGGGGGGGRAGARNRAADAALREAEAVARLIENLEHELATMGLTDAERAKANALRQAGAAATDQQRERIGQLIDAINAEREAKARSAEMSQFFQQVTEDAFMSLIPTINTGNDALDNLLNTLIKVVAQAALLGKGPLAGLFGGGGGFFGGLFPFANGGVAAHGRPQPMKTFARGGVSRSAAIFGEAGPEAAVPLPDGRRIPVDLRLPNGMGQQSQPGITIYNTIDATGADPAGLARVERGLADLKSAMPAMVERRNRIASSRGTRPET